MHASAGGTGPAGSLSAYTTRLIASKPFQTFRDTAKSINKLFPLEIQQANAKIDEYARGMVTGGTLFEELGFYYIGPVSDAVVGRIRIGRSHSGGFGADPRPIVGRWEGDDESAKMWCIPPELPELDSGPQECRRERAAMAEELLVLRQR